jgi:hypothetical protein
LRSKNGDCDNSGKLWATVSLRKRVYEIEQRVFGSLETSIDGVTKRLQRVNVHLENAPFWFFGSLRNITPSGNLLPVRIA